VPYVKRGDNARELCFRSIGGAASVMKAIIAGGGIGGLTAALCFNHFGWGVEVLEKAPELGEVGAGIQLSPNAMKVFEALGLGEALAGAAFRPEAIEIRMGESGMRLIRTPLGDTAARRWGSPYLHIHRADLIAVLRDALADRAPDAVRLGAGVERYEQEGQTVSAVLSGGERITADLLVGADGIHSAIRTQMLGPDSPVFTGNVAWRSVVPVERLGKVVPDPVACAWMGRGKHAVTYLLRGGQLANLVAVVERDDWTKESWTEPGSREEALRDFAGWHPTITRLIEESDQLFRWALFDRPPLKSWTDGRAAIMGDAAHPMLPFMAQGAAMAIEDAWALAALTAASGDIPSALSAYQKLRHPRASAVQARSRANAKTFHQRSVPGRLRNYGPIWLAGRLAPGAALARQDHIYGYDIVRSARVHIDPGVADPAIG
ncbi:MAG: FAD-dependent monooxygenase, partial [Pseudomonadota bacterium]